MALSQDIWSFENNGLPKDSNPNYLCTIAYAGDEENKGFILTANLPQEIQIGITASYDAAFAQSANSIKAVSDVKSMLGAIGIQTTTQAMTAQIWQGSSDIRFSLALVFQAINDEYTDILDKIEKLYSLVLPGQSSVLGLLTAPGPRLDPEVVIRNVAGTVDNTLTQLGNKIGVSGSTNVVTSAVNFGKKLFSSSSSSAGNPVANDPQQKGAKTPLIEAVKNNISLQIGKYMYFESVVIESVDQSHKVQPLKSGIMSHVTVTVGFKTFYSPVKSDITRIFRNENIRPTTGSRR